MRPQGKRTLKSTLVFTYVHTFQRRKNKKKIHSKVKREEKKLFALQVTNETNKCQMLFSKSVALLTTKCKSHEKKN